MRYTLALTLTLAPVVVFAAGSPPEDTGTTFRSRANPDRQVTLSSPTSTRTIKRTTRRQPPATRAPRPGYVPRAITPATPVRPSAPSAAKAALFFNMSLEKADAATATLNQAKEETDPTQKRALFIEAKRGFEHAILGFEEAVEQDPEMVGAWNELGYARRRLGNYEGALVAYSKALALDPNYLPAIEYQAEAYLGLNRVEPAKQAYSRLFREDRKLAAELEAAMRRWVSSRSQNPKGASKQTVAEFSAWLQKRTRLASQVPPVGGGAKSGW